MMRNDQDAPAAALPADHAERRRAMDPERSFIVRAPAGSGKTTLLIRRYLVLLTRVEQPEEILCMTFTRKAAGEMRHRVLAALRRAETGERGDTPEADAWARAALTHADARGWNLLRNPSRLQFHTIDGFGATLVRRMPRASGFGAMPDVQEFPAALYRKAASAAIDCMDDGDGPAARAARAVLDSLDNEYERLRQLIVDMLGSRDQWLWLTALQDDAGEREALERCWDRIVTRRLRRVRDAMSADPALAKEVAACAEAAARRLCGEGSASPLTACRGLTALPDATTGDLPAWRGVAELLLTRSGTVRTGRGVTKTIGFPSDGREAGASKQRMMALLDCVRGGDDSWVDDLHAVRYLPRPGYDDRQWRTLCDLLTLLKQAAARLNLDIGETGRCDYIALAHRARVALGTADDPTDLALALDRRIRHVLVDEFQDTSQAQMDLLALLTAGWDGSDARTLFLVGDPMQSIYAFRRADVGIYLRTAERGIGQLTPEPLTLTANFRSQRPLVDWVNGVFARAMPKRPDALSGAVEFAESTVSGGGATDAGVIMHAFSERDGTGEAARVADVAREERRAHAHAAIAILAHSRSHLPAILRALDGAGVPYQEAGLDPLAQRPLIQDLLALTRALLHPSDRTAWLAVLRAPWCGLELRDLEALCGESRDVWDALCRRETLDGLSAPARARLTRVVPALEQALAQRGRLEPARWIENAWLRLGGAALASRADWPDARRYFDQLRGLCESTGLRDYQELDERLRALRSVAGSGTGDAPSEPVQVMTMHAAKGLEFDVVLIPGLARSTKSDEKQLMLWDDHKDAGETTPCLLLAPLPVPDDAAADGERDAGGKYEYLRVFLKARERLEDARLLYVACTRAKRRLHLFATLMIKEDGTPAPPRNGTLLSRIWTSCADDVRGALERGGEANTPPSPGRTARRKEAQTRLLRVPDGWEPPAPSASIPLRPARAEGAEREDGTPTFDWAGQPARLAGIIVHRMLCLIAEQGLRVWTGARLRTRRTAWAAELKAQGLDRASIRRVIGDIEAALRFSLEDPRGRWIFDDRHRDARNEYDISGIVNGRVVRRRLDRIMTDADGVCWIIDYKVGAHRGVDLDVFLDNERERYRARLDGCATLVSRMIRGPIRLGLYFPLARGWREWAWSGNGERS